MKNMKYDPVKTRTIGDLVRAILLVDSEDEASKFYISYIKWLKDNLVTIGHTPEQVAKSNIGWCFGEGMAPDRIAMWRKVCGASHPIFGTCKTMPTPQEAVAAGMRAAIETGRATGGRWRLPRRRDQ